MSNPKNKSGIEKISLLLARAIFSSVLISLLLALTPSRAHAPEHSSKDFVRVKNIRQFPYQIKKGDTLQEVAQFLLEPPSQWTKISYDKTYRKNSRTLYPGDKILIYGTNGKHYLQLSRDVETKPKHLSWPDCKHCRHFEGKTQVEHIVKPRDTLWDLSRYFFINPWLWHSAWVNNSNVDNPHVIYPGQKLILRCLQPTRQKNTSVMFNRNFYYHPEFDIVGKLGNQRHFVRLSYLQPLLQKSDRIWFVNVIFMGDDIRGASQHNLEGNFGLGYRHMIHEDYILGAYGYFDLRKTRFKNIFRQFTGGFEYLGRQFEFRANIYIPEYEKKEIFHIRNTHTNVTGNLSVIDFVNHRQFEAPLRGFDVELGGAFNEKNSLLGFMTFYHFRGKGLPPLNGVRLRTRYRLTNWFSLEAEINYDKARRLASFFGTRFTWNLGNRRNPDRDILDRKMTQRPERDIDIIIEPKDIKSSGSLKEQFQNEMEQDDGTSIMINSANVRFIPLSRNHLLHAQAHDIHCLQAECGHNHSEAMIVETAPGQAVFFDHLNPYPHLEQLTLKPGSMNIALYNAVAPHTEIAHVYKRGPSVVKILRRDGAGHQVGRVMPINRPTHVRIASMSYQANIDRKVRVAEFSAFWQQLAAANNP